MAILAALESPHLFSGVVLVAPMIMANPDQATPFRVTATHIILTLFLCIYVVCNRFGWHDVLLLCFLSFMLVMEILVLFVETQKW